MVERCIQCGRCSANCPVAGQMDIPPHKWVYRARNGNVGTLPDLDSIWECLSCLCCEARCPRGVKPAQVAEEARRAAMQMKGADDLRPEEVSDLITSKTPPQLVVAAFRKGRRT